MIVVVRPWKFWSATMISALPSGTPLMVYAHFRASLIAVSTASAPVFIGQAMSLSVYSHSFFRKSAISLVYTARLVSVRMSSCCFTVSTMYSLRCPFAIAE